MKLVRVCFLILIQWTGLTMATEQVSQGVVFSAAATEYVVGDSIPVTLTYKNTTPTQVIFKEPLKTWEMKFRVIRCDMSPEDRPFGRMSSYTTATGIERRTVEEAKKITLDPGKEITFDYDVGARWPELFSPGVIRVSVVDLHDEPWRKASNELTWHMTFKPESVDHLLAILNNDKSTFDAKTFAVKWLSTLNPDLRFKVGDADVATTRKNQTALENFRKWWLENRNTDSVVRQLGTMNRS